MTAQRPPLEAARLNVLSLATLSELHQRQHGHAIPLQPELGAALRDYLRLGGHLSELVRGHA